MTLLKMHPSRRAALMALGGVVMAGRAFASPPDDTPKSLEPEQATSGAMTPAAMAMKAWLDEFGRPTAHTMLNGGGPFEFMVDTGANSTVIAARHIAALGAPIVGKSVVNGTTGSIELPVARIAELSTGAASAKDLDVAVMPEGSIDSDGILGADIFAGKRLTFDITNKQVRVEFSGRSNIYGPSTGTRITTGRVINIRNGMLAEVLGTVGRVKARLMLDTGAQSCIMNMRMADELRRVHPALVRYPNVRVTGVTGQTLIGEYYELPNVDMGEVAVRAAGAVAADAPIFAFWGLVKEPAMIVGVDVLSRLRGFTIDYGAKRFEAKPMAALVGSLPRNA